MQPDAPPPLLTTNMHVPQLHGQFMARPALIDKLDQALNFPLTLISAPAGFGKTTLLVQWITSRGGEKLQDRVAWVSMENEGDLRRFWRYILAALEGVQPGTGESGLALLDTPQSPIHTIPTVVINEVSSLADDFILILDDYHLVDDPAIHTALNFFIDHLPANLHVLVASRSQPPLSLARWRASNRLYELRENDLRFTTQEVETFLNETKALHLSEDDVAALGSRTEGWIAGLQLVALSMQGYDELAKQSFISDFTGSQRYIFDYLVMEVLQRQPDHLRTFLLQTSVLDRLSASLCNAVTEQGDGQAVLEHLERANMFTIPLDHERRWYRYHHLFRDVLRHRLQHEQPDAVLALHRRATAWYIEDGQPESAIRHACAGQQWDQAAELIESRISTSWNRGEVRRILTWLGRLPDEYLDADLNLSLYYSRALLLGGQMEAAERRLRDAETGLRARLAEHEAEEERLLLGTVCAFRTTVAGVTGETRSALRLGEEALSLLPKTNKDVRAHAMNSLGVTHYYLGDMVNAARMCAKAGGLAQQAGNLYLVMAAATYRAKALTCQGQLRQAEQTLAKALSLTNPPNWPGQTRIPAASVACASYGRLLYEWNRLEEAEHYLNEAIELGQHLAFGSALWSAYHTLARIRVVHGDQDGALGMIERAQRYRESHSVPLPARLMAVELAQTRLALGQRQAVERWARTSGPDRVASSAFVQEIETVTLARLCLAQDRPERALILLSELHPSVDSGGREGHVIEILALTALAQYAMDNSELAMSTLQEALAMAEPEGYLRTFVDTGRPMAALLYQALESDLFPDYVSELLAAFPADEMASDAPSDSLSPAHGIQANDRLIEPLTLRELEVLQLVADGASNQDIAEELTIAMSTAKKHVSNIINKLGVDNRTEAAAIGRNLGLC